MNIEDFVKNLKDTGLSDDEVVSALMSGVYFLACESPENADRIFESAGRKLEMKKNGFKTKMHAS